MSTKKKQTNETLDSRQLSFRHVFYGFSFAVICELEKAQVVFKQMLPYST